MLKHLLLAAMLCFTAVACRAQHKGKIYTAVEQSAEFPGGIDEFYSFLAKNIHYPKLKPDDQVVGKSIVTFVIEKDGTLSSFEPLHKPASVIDSELIRVLKLSPRWQPARNKGKLVRMQYTVPMHIEPQSD